MLSATFDSNNRRLSEREAAQYLGVRQRTLADWRLKGICLPYSRLGKRVVYESVDLDRFLQAGRVEPKAAV